MPHAVAREYGEGTNEIGDMEWPRACYLRTMSDRGVTLIELAIVLLIVGALAAMAGPKVVNWSNRLAVLRAAEEIAAFHRDARLRAIYGSMSVRIALSSDSLTAIAEGAGDSLLTRLPGPARLGVSLTSSRGVIRLYPNGLGLGAANTKIVLRRGQAAESLTVSRLGRLKRWR